MKILVTGAAGFIGFFTAKALLDRGHSVVGLDNLNAYYDPALKEARLAQLQGHPTFRFVRGDLADKALVDALFAEETFDRVVNLAAQAGVRYSLENPDSYAQSNLIGFLNVLEACRHAEIEHLVYASSSSVYGLNRKLPFSEHAGADHPVSLYGATKKANEMMAHSYAHLFGLPVTGLRFFTVYGPWGRPDMAIYIFTKKIFAGEPIDIFNDGHNARDFTYIDDIVEGLVRTLDLVPAPNPAWAAETPDPATSSAPYRLYNIGNHQSVPVMDCIACIERATGREAIKRFLPMQPGDVEATYAEIDDLEQATGFQPSTSLQAGVDRFVVWFREYYRI